MEKHLYKLKCKRKFFVKYFIVSLLLMIFMCLLMMFFRHGIYHIVDYFYNLTYKEFGVHVMRMMCLWKLFIIQFALAPAIAFFCREKQAEKEIDEEEYGTRRM